MKVIAPDFVMPLVRDLACDEFDVCEFVLLNRDGHATGDIDGAEALMLPWGLSAGTLQRLVGLPSLRWIQTLTVGIDHVLANRPPAAPLLITNARGVFDIPIAEMVVAYMLTIYKRIRECSVQQSRHEWKPLRLRELAGLTVGLIGMGGIGREISKRCRAMGMRVLGTRRHPERGADDVDALYSLDRWRELLPHCDFVVVAVPLTPETRGMIGGPELKQMKPDAWLINIARGAIIQEDALLRALAEGWIGGAALDVFDQEPLPSESFLWDLPNVIITPHCSWSTPHFRQREAELFLDNLRRYLRGEPLRNVVDLESGY